MLIPESKVRFPLWLLGVAVQYELGSTAGSFLKEPSLCVTGVVEVTDSPVEASLRSSPCPHCPRELHLRTGWKFYFVDLKLSYEG